MEWCEFQSMQDSEKIAQLYRNGVYIGKRRCSSEVVLLYQLDSFYVEVYYSKYRSVIDRLQTFRSTVHLDPYLDQIPIEPIELTG